MEGILLRTNMTMNSEEQDPYTAPDKWNIHLYICWNKYAKACYTATSMFHDLFPDMYTKPVYVEKTTSTSYLSGRCKERQLLGRTFYSLIKNPEGTYRFNSEIYKDVHEVLGLEFETSHTLAFDLIKLPPGEIEMAYSPGEAYAQAHNKNRTLQSTIQYLLKEMPVFEENLGLIGSLAVDSGLDVRDLDLVFHGPIDVLDVANEWILQGPKVGPPFRRALPAPLPILCGFFSARPSAYSELTTLRMLEDQTEEIEVMIRAPRSGPYLNIQVYLVFDFLRQRDLLLVIRDPLGRDALKKGMSLSVKGYPSSLLGKPAILVTDVESQIQTVNFHAGGTRCYEQNGD